MTKKTLGFGKRIISTHTHDIDSAPADERPVGIGSGVVVFKESGIFAKDVIFGEDASDSRFPTAHECLGKIQMPL